jgi:uncharacterized protein with GYD domain
MSRSKSFLVATIAIIGLAVLPNGAHAQQATPTVHRYLTRAVLTAEGVKNLQKQPPTALRAAVAKLVGSVGGKLETWYFDYTGTTGYGIIDYPDEISAAVTQITVNGAGFAHVTMTPLISAEDADKAVARMTHPPQLQ